MTGHPTQGVTVEEHDEWLRNGRPCRLDIEVADLVEELRRIREDNEREKAKK